MRELACVLLLVLADLLGDPLPEGARARLGTARLRHDGAVCFAQSGELLATGGAGLKVFELPSGRLRFARDWTVASLAWASTGVLAVATGDFKIRVLDAQGATLARAIGHEGPVRGLAFSPDARLLASASDDGAACLWNARTGAEVREIMVRRPVRSVAFTKDGERLATEDEKGARRFFSVKTGRDIEAAELAPVASSAYSVELRPGKRIAVRELASGRALAFSGHESPVRSLAFSPDGSELASGGDDAVFVWDTSRLVIRDRREGRLAAFGQGGALLRMKGPSGLESAEWSARGAPRDLTAFAVSSEGVVATGASDQLVRFLAPGRRTSSVQAWGRVSALAWSAAGDLLAESGEDGFVRFFDPSRAREVRRVDLRSYFVTALAFSSEDALALACTDGAVRIWTREGVETAQLSGHAGRVLAVAFSKEGKLASGGEDGTVRLWDQKRAQKLRVLEPGQGAVRALAFSPDGATLATAGDDGTVLLFTP